MNSSLTITGIQANLAWEDKKANLRMFEEKISTIPAGTEIIVLPEMFSTGFSMNPSVLAEDMNGETVRWMKKIANERKAILTGSLILEQDGKYFNRLVWCLPGGQTGYYDKRHLFAYGTEDRFYSPGAKRLIASVNGWKINLLVCYDLRFPVWARQNRVDPGGSNGNKITAPEYDVLVYVANWPERRINAWKTLLQARAIENQCYVAGVNRVGDDGNGIHYSGASMVVDPAGDILYLGGDKEDCFTVSLDRSRLEAIREKFPFWKDADEFQIKI